jgi:catechol 2,3-dioxygenase-like lactoylglutathione lyase family enzyme
MQQMVKGGVCAIHSVDRFVLGVPALAAAADFFGAFGLRVTPLDDRLQLRTHHDSHVWADVLVASGGRKRLEYLSLGAYACDLDGLRSMALAAGAQEAAAHPACMQPDGFWIRDPDGNLLQIAAREKCTPRASARGQAAPIVYAHNPAGASIAPLRAPPEVKPRRLSHVLLFSTDVLRATEFYANALGLRLSDKSADIVAFMHGAHASDHHLLAFFKSSAPGLHHTSWLVESLDEVGLGMEQMLAAGYREGWGVGRHVIGSNFFYYARDPWGSFSEYAFDIDFVEADGDWPARDYPPDSALYFWGPEVPGYFALNTEIEVLGCTSAIDAGVRAQRCQGAAG